jgi:hypothetical protein
LKTASAEHGLTSAIGEQGYKWLGVAFFALMGALLYRLAIGKKKQE